MGPRRPTERQREQIRRRQTALHRVLKTMRARHPVEWKTLMEVELAVVRRERGPLPGD